MGDHNFKGQLSKRPLIEASSTVGPDLEQKTVKTTLGESELVIVAHQKDGWLYHSSIQQGGNELLIIFER